MFSLPQQNKERNLLTQFLHSIHYQSSSGNMPYGNALNILSAIFEASGQQHLLYLVKLRKLWFDKIDSFLARNAYPRNISVIRHFTVSDDFIKEIVRDSVSADDITEIQILTGIRSCIHLNYAIRFQHVYTLALFVLRYLLVFM